MFHKNLKFCSNNDFCKMYIYKAMVYLHWYTLTKLHSRQWTWILNLWSSFTREYRSEKQPKKPRRHQKTDSNDSFDECWCHLRSACSSRATRSGSRTYACPLLRRVETRSSWSSWLRAEFARETDEDYWREATVRVQRFSSFFVVSSHADGGGSFAATRKGICHA